MKPRQEQINRWVTGHPRTMGVILLALGGLLFHLGVYAPYLDALANAHSIGVRAMSASFMSPLCMLLGLLLMILGPRAVSNSRLNPPPTTRNKLLIAFALLAFWVVFAAPYCAIIGRIEALGYRIKGEPVSYVYKNVVPLSHLARLADRFIP